MLNIKIRCKGTKNSFNTQEINENYVLALYLVKLVLKRNNYLFISQKCYIFAVSKLN